VSLDLLAKDVREKYEVAERHHACAILKNDFPKEWGDVHDCLRSFRLRKSEILTPGGRKSPISTGINGFFAKRGWKEKRFQIRVLVDSEEVLSPTHHVDYFKNRVAIETEWNNKDPFADS